LDILFDSTERSGVMKDAEYVCHFRFSNRAYYWDTRWCVKVFVSHRFPWTAA